MAYASGDGIETPKVHKKYRGLIKITNEMMAQGILGLPKGVDIIDVYSDHREIIHFRLISNEPHKETFETGEGMEFVQSADVHKLYIKKAIRTVRALEAQKDDDWFGKIYREALAEIEAEEAEGNA